MQDLSAVLSEKRCEECGVIVISKDDSRINLGAMNPSFPEVKKLKDQLQKLGIEKVVITAIASDDWERWQDDSGKAVFTAEHQEIQDHIDAEIELINKHKSNSSKELNLTSQRLKATTENPPSTQIGNELSSDLSLLDGKVQFDP